MPISLQRLSKLPGKRKRENRTAYEIYVQSHGADAKRQYPTEQSLLHGQGWYTRHFNPSRLPPAQRPRPAGWYARRVFEHRFFVRNEQNEIVGLAGYSTRRWIDKKNENMTYRPIRYQLRNITQPLRSIFSRQSKSKLVRHARTVNQIALSPEYISLQGVRNNPSIPDSTRPVRTAEIGIMTLPEKQGQGAASQTLLAIEKEIRKKGIRVVYLDTAADNHAMMRAAEKAGYQKTEPVEISKGRFRIRLFKKL